MTPLWQWCLAASLAFSWTLPAAETQGTDSLRDQQLQERIQKDLKKQGIKNLEITVRDQTVTLRGKVRSVWAKEKALE
ncbi:MAG: BON domain-containing protein, partial [Acidobacteriota bacterium]